MKQGSIGGVVTRVRLAIARAVLWTAWHFAYWGMMVLLRKEHPFRVYIKGAMEEVYSIQLASLRHTNGCRLRSVTRWKLIAGSIATASIFTPEMKLIKGAISVIAAAAM